MSRKTVPKSLFTPARSTEIKDPRAFFRRLIEHTPQQQLDDALAVMLEAAATAEVDSNIEQGKRYADRIRTSVALVNNAREQGDADASALWAARATQAWMELRMDATTARPVRSEQHRTAALTKTKKPPREIIQAAINSTKSFKKAAAKLGVAPKTLRLWRKEEKLR